MKKILIIGAGYAGLRALEHLAKNPTFSITLIDKNPYHYMQTEAYGYIAGHFDISDIAIDLSSFVDGFSQRVSFIKEKALHIDKEKNILLLESQQLHYDYAIIAVGAQTNFFSFIEGAKEHTHGVKNIQRAFEFRQAFEKRLYLKLEDKKLNRDGDLHIAIAGAGLSGVEIAAEMAYTLKRYHKILSKKSIELKISLIDAAPTILPGMDAYIVKKTEKSAEYVAKSIIQRECKEACKPFDAKVDGVFVALGGKYAVGLLYKYIKVEGYIAYILKKLLTRFYRFGLEIKVNVGYKKRT